MRVLVLDVSPVCKLLYRREEIKLLTVEDPVRFILDIMLHRYPYMDNFSLLVSVISSVVKDRTYTYEELDELKDFYNEIGIILHRLFTSHIHELDLYSSSVITWLDSTSVIMETP